MDPVISVSVFGRVDDPGLGRPVDVHEVTLDGPDLRVGVLTLGAGLNRVQVRDAAGSWHDVCLHLRWFDPDGGRGPNRYLGATIGRYANRIAGARFSLDGRSVALAANEGPNHLHGGPDGFDRRVWDLVELDGPGSVTLTLRSDDGDQGYPGTLVAAATYSIQGSTLTVAYRATTNAPTVVNLCNHAYWNLDGSGTVMDHELRVPADRYLPLDAHGLPVGAPRSVEGTTFDLRRPTRVREVTERRGAALDDAYLLDAPIGPDGRRAAAWLRGGRSGLTLAVRTDRPGLHVYDGRHLEAPFVPHAGLCLETQALPDTPNHPDLGSCELRPGDASVATTTYTFGVEPT